MLVMAPVFFTLLLLISVYVLIFRTLLYYLDLLYTNMCPIEIPAKGQLREVRMKVPLQQFKLHALHEILEVLCYLNFILPYIYLYLYDTCLQMPLLGKNMFLHVLFALIAIVLLKLLASFVMQSSQIDYQEGQRLLVSALLANKIMHLMGIE